MAPIPTQSRAHRLGFSLVEVLVAAGALSVVSLILGSLIFSLTREKSALVDQLAASDLTRSVTEALHFGRCTLMLAPSNLASGSSLTFDSTSASENTPAVIQLKAIPLSSTVNLIAQANPVISALSPRLKLASQGIRLEMTGATTGRLRVKFDPTGLVRAIRDLEFPLAVSTTGSGSATTLVGCGSLATSLPVGTLISCSWARSMGGAPPNPPCQSLTELGWTSPASPYPGFTAYETTECSSGWMFQSCHGATGLDCCVKVDGNALP